MNNSTRSERGARPPIPVRVQVRRELKRDAFEDPRLRAVADTVYKAIGKSVRVSLREAAHVARYSPTHFSQCFHDSAGVRFSTWEFALRMEHAENLLLRKPRMQVDAVANKVGYHDTSAFSRAFKRYAGINCRQLRRLAKICPTLATDSAAIERLDYVYFVATCVQKNT